MLVGFGPDPYCPQRPSCRPLARELISVPGRDSIMRTVLDNDHRPQTTRARQRQSELACCMLMLYRPIYAMSMYVDWHWGLLHVHVHATFLHYINTAYCTAIYLHATNT